MINDDEKYYYFAVKSKLKLYSSEWLRSKKQSLTNEAKWCIKLTNLKPYINQYNCKDIKFSSDKEDWKKFE